MTVGWRLPSQDQDCGEKDTSIIRMTQGVQDDISVGLVPVRLPSVLITRRLSQPASLGCVVYG